MAKFIMLNMFDTMTTYSGPSGIRYTINQNIPFEVSNESDLAFFRTDRQKKRFKEISIFSKAPSVQEDRAEFESELRKIKKLSEKTIKKVLEVYTKEMLIQTVLEKTQLDPEISPSQQDLIINYIESTQYPESVKAAETEKSEEIKKEEINNNGDKVAKEETKESEEPIVESLETKEETEPENTDDEIKEDE